MKSSRNVRNYFQIAAMQRRTFSLLSVGIAIVAMLSGVVTAQSPSAASASDKSIRPFHVNIPKAVAEMRKPIAATRWPEKETVTDTSQGVQLATMEKLARYWATDYDWRKCEAKLKALPQFITTINGVDIHFIHVRSKNPNVLPIISVFPDEIYAASRSWTEKAYPKLIYYNRLPKGTHFAAWEQPELFVGEMRAAFKSLR